MPANLPSKLILAATMAWSQVLRLGPYVAGGILLAALLTQLDLPLRWGDLLKGKGPGAVLGAACLGGASPLCTYGTVPILIELVRGGASPGPALAFLVSSSLLNPQMFILMIGGLKLRLALAHVCGVLLLSVPVGLASLGMNPEVLLNSKVLCTTHVCPGKHKPGLLHTLLRLTETIGLHFVVGVTLAALLRTLIPTLWVSSLLGTGRWYGVLLAGILGIPLYACGGGAVPVIAGLLGRGMSPGAALAFFLAGPSTRVTALAALGSLLNRRALAIYIGYIVVGAALAGAALNIVMGA